MGLIEWAERLYTGVSMSLLSRYSVGTNIYQRDWDLLILLDTCRIDALGAVADGFEFICDVGSHTSLGSSSPEFMTATFTEAYRDEIENTAYLSGNAHSEHVFETRQFPEQQNSASVSWTDWDTVEADAFGLLDHVWRYTERLPTGPCDPMKVIDRAIQVDREESFGRVIVHLQQPHAPYVSRIAGTDADPEPYEKNPFSHLTAETRDEIWASYLAELRYVLGKVEVLLNNFEADRAIISADHGELFGRFLFNHPSGILHPDLRRVPWAPVEAPDSGEFDPEVERSDEIIHPASERLKELGYLE